MVIEHIFKIPYMVVRGLGGVSYYGGGDLVEFLKDFFYGLGVFYFVLFWGGCFFSAFMHQMNAVSTKDRSGHQIPWN